LRPWLLNHVQQNETPKTPFVYDYAVRVNSIVLIYQWIDWWIYTNLLLAQVDFVFIELTCHFIISTIVLKTYYLNDDDYKSNHVYSCIENNEPSTRTH
jgi:hypothetical protein